MSRLAGVAGWLEAAGFFTMVFALVLALWNLTGPLSCVLDSVSGYVDSEMLPVPVRLAVSTVLMVYVLAVATLLVAHVVMVALDVVVHSAAVHRILRAFAFISQAVLGPLVIGMVLAIYVHAVGACTIIAGDEAVEEAMAGSMPYMKAAVSMYIIGLIVYLLAPFLAAKRR